jgi:hypothetical protein
MPPGLEVAGTRALLQVLPDQRCRQRPSGVIIMARSRPPLGPGRGAPGSAPRRAGIVLKLLAGSTTTRGGPSGRESSPVVAVDAKGFARRAGQRAELTRRLMSEV